MSVNDRSDIHWAPKVSLSKIRLLYLREAHGLCSNELIDEVGLGLYFRCESILEFTEAVQNIGFAPGRVTLLLPQTIPYIDLGDLWLEVPKLGLKVPIIGV